VILLLETVHAEALRVLEDADELRLVAKPPDLDTAVDLGAVRALVTRGRGRVSAEVLAQLPALEVVARCGAGLDNIDTAAAAAAGVAVVHTPGSTTNTVAEHAAMLMLALARQLVPLDVAAKAGNWAIREQYQGIELHGKRLGIIGLGAIGSRLAEIGAALGMQVGYSARHNRDVPYERLDLERLLQVSDVVQICLPLKAETAGLVGSEQLTLMKSDALLVNTARGGIVDHVALRSALEGGRLGGYAADVWSDEPPISSETFAEPANVLLTPHIAAITDATYREMCTRAASAVHALLMGNAPEPACIYRG
jgi:D-3-phosphoglycerate dehydrogenase / 2-oxoglutarate reductase